MKEERTACIKRIRGLLAEFGIVIAQNPRRLRERLADILEDASNELDFMARQVLDRAFGHWRQLDEEVRWCDERIAVHNRENDDVKIAAQLGGIGPITASAVVATVGDFKQFRSGSQFGAWLGLTPRQRSSGGKASLGHNEARRHLPADVVDPGCSLRRAFGSPTNRSDFAMGHQASRPVWVAEGSRGACQ